MMRRRFAALLAAIAVLAGPALFAAPSAQATGEVTYPGAGWADSSSVYRDVVYCLGDKNNYWLEVQVRSVRSVSGGQVYIDPFELIVSRIYHGQYGVHFYRGWATNFSENRPVINVWQRQGPVPQTTVNSWINNSPTRTSLASFGDPIARINGSNSGLNWTNQPESQNPHMYFQVITAENPSGREEYNCTIDLGPQPGSTTG